MNIPNLAQRGACAILLLAACGGSAASAPGATSAPKTPVATSARPAHWGYAGERGPAHWSRLSDAYAACSGQRQSPIDLPPASGGDGAHVWKMNYLTTGLKIAHHGHVTDILDNGHTIQVTVEPGSMLVTPQGSYELKQFHFHSPSEHTVEGKSFPMEAHFVHQSAQGDFAVVAVLFSEGPTNENLATLITHFPPRLGDSYVRPDVKLDLRLHVPAASHAPALYTGSFTTPPCTEPVAWLVFRTPFYASAEQLAAFADKLQHNNRPIQALHERRVDSGSLAGAPQSSAP